MRSYQNQLERFSTIAKRLVDDHSAELYTRCQIGSYSVVNDVYYNHLDGLSKQLNERAEQFIGSTNVANEDLKTEIWNTCKKYIDQFIKRNQPDK
jgi:hypothetical protein